MKIDSDVARASRYGDDAIEAFYTAVNNGQARLAMSILVDVISGFNEKFDELDEKLNPNQEIKPEKTTQPVVEEVKPEPKPKAKEAPAE